MNYPKTIKDLIECFKRLPGIGEKSAERLALSTINMDNDVIKLFATSLTNVIYVEIILKMIFVIFVKIILELTIYYVL